MAETKETKKDAVATEPTVAVATEPTVAVATEPTVAVNKENELLTTLLKENQELKKQNIELSTNQEKAEFIKKGGKTEQFAVYQLAKTEKIDDVTLESVFFKKTKAQETSEMINQIQELESIKEKEQKINYDHYDPNFTNKFH